MIKEIINFSKKLEADSVYAEVQGKAKELPLIMVIPVNEDLTEFLIQDIHYILDKKNEKVCSKNPEQFKNLDAQNLDAQNLDAQELKWKSVLESLPTFKVPAGCRLITKNNRCYSSYL